MALPSEYKNKLILQFQTMGKHLRESCQLCKGDGSIPSKSYGVASRCPACMGKFDELKKYVYSGMSPDYLKCDLDTSDYTKETKSKMNRILAGYPHYFGQINFIFHKVKYNPSAYTIAGVLLLRRFIDAGYESFYIDFSTLFDYFLSFKDDSELKNSMVKYCTQVPILMIDNFCNNFFKTETREGFLFQNLEKLLRMRVNTGLTILATTVVHKELHTNFKLLSPVLTQHFQPIEIYSDLNKGKLSESLNGAKIPDELKKLFKAEHNKNTQGESPSEVLSKISKTKKSNDIDSMNRG